MEGLKVFIDTIPELFVEKACGPCLLSVRRKGLVVSFILTLLPMLISENSMADVFVSPKLAVGDLDTNYFPDKDKKSDSAATGGMVSIGNKFNDWFAVEGVYSEFGGSDRYKVGELTGLSKTMADFINLITFGLVNSDIEATVDMNARAVGVNAIAYYKFFFVQAGFSKWSTTVDISIPNQDTVSYQDSGIEYGYGGGVHLGVGKHWGFLLQMEEHSYGDMDASMAALGVSYTF